MWTIWEERFEIYDEVFLFAKGISPLRERWFVVFHKKNGKTGVSSLTEGNYYNEKEKLRNAVAYYDNFAKHQLSPIQRALSHSLKSRFDEIIKETTDDTPRYPKAHIGKIDIEA
jgi:hypothetical protein